MLFTSFEFIFAFLPVAFLGFFLLARFWGREAAAIWLAAASLFFYGWWSTTYIALLLSSILFNYCIGYLICKNQEANIHVAKTALYVGIVSNLALLCYYKYTNFFLGEISRLTGVHIPSLSLILPLGISFFTFTQIAFLVDTWKGKAKEYNFSHYILFVTWFPHLIAGPILHHGQMMPQFKDPAIYKPSSRNIAIGIALFAVGLGKKLLLADPISTYADPLFHAAATGQAIGTMVAWAGAVAYTLQIYFDFSGYSDMAVGLSLLFGIRLPINFNSPYKATNIIEFWRRWHMTLSQFLRDYLYIPLGGNRKGEIRRLVNLSLTMLLGGLWHGASWTFIIWGGLHGAYLCVNHIFQKLPRSYLSGLIPRFATNAICVAMTFAAVIFAWVFFRAENVHSAIAIAHAMLGSEQAVSWDSIFKNLSFITYVSYILASMFIIWALPNIYEVIDLLENRVAVNDQEGQRISSTVCVAAAMTCVAIVVTSLLSTFGSNIISPFLYFQF
ncbi:MULTISPECIES: MBOAT family protein [unclassified Pseudomonas]|uniref:MBOAT family O-acyltransferase n=1 Tax=unclassified Pseudomonas TaxID=196821 RepID=UPI000537488F|nr:MULTISPECIES: MBOAT family protein [unclassified Pseudomonas]MBD0686122.1 MBOAT family protein [Pseudomonas sp. PSB18]CDF96842.1 Probable poly(beta-D-mannuronate) O-acetylase [Pseudomonas sp. SHC52]